MSRSSDFMIPYLTRSSSYIPVSTCTMFKIVDYLSSPNLKLDPLYSSSYWLVYCLSQALSSGN